MSPDSSGNFSFAIYPRSSLAIGSYLTALRLRACQDKDCQIVLSNGVADVDIDFNIRSPNNRPPAIQSTIPVYLEIEVGRATSLYGYAYDLDDDPLTHHWALVSKPENSTAALLPNAVEQLFEPDQSGTYIIEHYVNDGELNSAVVRYTVLSISAPPVPVLAHSGALLHFPWSPTT